MSETELPEKNVTKFEITDPSKQQTRITKKEYNKFMYSFFNGIDDFSVAKQDGINVAIIRLGDDKKCEESLNNINKQIFKHYTQYIETDLKKNAKMVDRSMLFESEIKAGTLFIRWV